MKKNIEDSIKDELTITATTTGTFYLLKTGNLKSPKASLDAMDIMKLAGVIVGGVLVKDYAAYKKWRVMPQKNLIALLRAIKLNNIKCRSILRRTLPSRVLL